MAHVNDWDAALYHRASEPQHAWGLRVLERLALRGDERVLDAGCGTGRVTAALAARLPAGRTVALDRSPDMTARARAFLPARVPVVRADLLALPFRAAFDVVFSTATFHWVLDPAALYAGLARVLRRGGRLHAQCGGAGNCARLVERVRGLEGDARFARAFAGWRDPWVFLAPGEAERHLRAAGFARVRAWLEPAPARFESRAAYREFTGGVVVRHWLARLPNDAARDAFLDAVCDAAGRDHEWSLDYVRLNLEAALEGTP